MVKQSQFVLPQLSSLYALWVKHMPQDFLVDLLIDCLALWQILTENNAPHDKECNQQGFDFWLPSVLAISETFIDCSGTLFLGQTQKSMSCYQLWLYKACLFQFEDDRWCHGTPACCAFKMIDDVMAHLHAVHLRWLMMSWQTCMLCIFSSSFQQSSKHCIFLSR